VREQLAAEGEEVSEQRKLHTCHHVDAVTSLRCPTTASFPDPSGLKPGLTVFCGVHGGTQIYAFKEHVVSAIIVHAADRGFFACRATAASEAGSRLDCCGCGCFGFSCGGSAAAACDERPPASTSVLKRHVFFAPYCGARRGRVRASDEAGSSAGSSAAASRVQDGAAGAARALGRRGGVRVEAAGRAAAGETAPADDRGP
jgi:hypothetical protein